jgi:nucleotide-binding universal stress UspA family protein
MEKDHHDQSQRMLSAVVSPQDQRAFDVETLVKSGDVAQQILSTIAEQETDLLIMGAHGRGPVGHYLIGSVAHKVLRNIEIPILTVGRVTRPPAFDRILLPTDFSDAGKEGLRYAFDLARTVHATLAAVHSVEVGVDGGAEAAVYLGAARVREARAKFDDWKTELSGQKTELETIVTEGPAADVILKTAEEKSADFIVITRETLVGSVAERVVRDANIPVLTIPFEKAKLQQTDGRRVA